MPRWRLIVGQKPMAMPRNYKRSVYSRVPHFTSSVALPEKYLLPLHCTTDRHIVILHMSFGASKKSQQTVENHEISEPTVTIPRPADIFAHAAVAESSSSMATPRYISTSP